MPYLASIGTYLPCWGAPQHRVAGDDEDAITLAVEAGRKALIVSADLNPSGGLKAKGHPPGAAGVAQCVELFAQLRGEAANQVDGARVVLAHNIGGPTAISAVTILEGSANGAG
jgi:acetyl-CoA C-acetyltransferase